jgi:hypothetical protein
MSNLGALGHKYTCKVQSPVLSHKKSLIRRESFKFTYTYAYIINILYKNDVKTQRSQGHPTKGQYKFIVSNT